MCVISLIQIFIYDHHLGGGGGVSIQIPGSEKV